MSAFVQASVVTFSNSPGKPQTVTMLLGDDTPVYVKATVVTLTDASGVPTATVTNTPPPISTPTVITTAGPDGVLRTITTSVLAAPRTTTMTDAHGAPTATLTEYPTYPSDPPTGSKIIKVYEVSDIAYFVGFFLPTILSGLLTIPIRMIDLSAKQYQPWHELTRVDGAIAGESLALRTSGMYGMTSSVRSLAGGQALVFLTTLLTLCSIALVPLSSEAVALKLHGNCTTTDFKGCAMTLGVFLGPARATVVLLACMAFLVILILVALRQWRSGLAANPWTIAGIASLSMNKDVRALFSSLPRGLRGRIPHSRLVEALDGKFFKLGYSADRGTPEYGIVIDHSVEPGMARTRSKLSFYLKRSRDSDRGGLEDNGTKHHLPFLMLSYTWRAVFLLFLSGVLIIILYYNNTGGDTPFERFMDTQNLGVRALFTLVGIGITFYWGSFFTSLAILSPYHVLSKKGQPAEHSVLLAPPLHALGGIWSAIRRGHPFLVVVAFTSILAEFMPILLNNVPYRLTQTYTTHTVCTWLAVGILFFMWLVIVASFFVSWPHMPVDPSTIAGAMFYVCDSQMLASFEGLSVLSKEERNRRVRDMKAEFRFGQMRGVSGVRRVGVDRVYEPVYG
ncbi:hypothetical protein QBC47DRAFT_299683 [Echria macrotheca]|uniref:Uncharacterized protein n=1 Tax=Echria macrotheca TaxID=438768 RepID=A0AAJ0FBZ3_9PEZI|nr:hypothetical protein QBC47DRAFT_299683 [Echria macrotheca]